MKRCFGMMPVEEVFIRGRYKDTCGLPVMIEAGPRGWTIIWADYSADYKDVEDTTENNFKTAYDTAIESVGPLIKQTLFRR